MESSQGQGGGPSTGSGPATGSGSPTGAGHPADPHERIDGLRAWITALERKLGVRTWAGAAAAVLGLAAAIVAIVLTLQTSDESATKDQLERLEDRVTTSDRQAGETFQEDLQTLTERIDALESRVSDLSGDNTTSKRQISVLEDDIQDLNDRVNDLEDGG